MQGKPVRIAVVYEPGKKPRPVWFELNRQQLKVKETTYYWRDKVGKLIQNQGYQQQPEIQRVSSWSFRMDTI